MEKFRSKESSDLLSPDEQIRCATEFLRLSEKAASQVIVLASKLRDGVILAPSDIQAVAAELNQQIFAEACKILRIETGVQRSVIFGPEDSE